MVLALAGTEHRYSAGGGRGIDSRHVAALSIDYANAMARVPSLGELCIAAHVSERTLRKAFVDEYDVPPARFFRMWALAEARRRLLDNEPTHRTVADVATGLGFFHLGRFASYYRKLYGETPSATLRVR
jgi:AraC family ethanolamine operon transcriptional activator